MKWANRRMTAISACALSAIVLLFSGCALPDDVATTVARTDFNLTIERLPEPPEGMIYQLWASKNAPISGLGDVGTIASGDLVSIARFSYLRNDTIVTLLDEALQPIDPEITFSDDLFIYRSLFVSIEPVGAADPDPNAPQNIMLIDNITGRSDQTLRLAFPLSDDLWLSTARFNMESVTDKNGSAGDGFGVWFSSYRQETRVFPDTFGIVNITVDTVEITPILNPADPSDTLNRDELYAQYLQEIINVRPDSVLSWFGGDSLVLQPDSFWHVFVRFDSVLDSNSGPPFTRPTFVIEWDSTSRNQTLEIFSQDNFGLPNYSDFGWRWQGWVVATGIPSSFLGALTEPGWPVETLNRTWITGYTGGLVSTGTFTDITGPDDADPFTFANLIALRDTLNPPSLIGDTVRNQPAFPGEDFLNGDSLQAYYGTSNPINLLSGEGSVLITLEPQVKIDLGLGDTTNFPLIAFSGEIPSSGVVSQSQVSVDMLNQTGTVPGTIVGTGFPLISITFDRR